MTLSKMTLSVMTHRNNVTQYKYTQYDDTQHYYVQCNDTQHYYVQYNDTQHNDTRNNYIQHNDNHHGTFSFCKEILEWIYNFLIKLDRFLREEKTVRINETV